MVRLRKFWRAGAAAASPQSDGPTKPRPAIGFMHIPKTAGTSLRAALQQAVKPEVVVSGFDQMLFGSFTAFESCGREFRSQLYLDGLPAADCYLGHFSLASLRAAPTKPKIMTVLREPRSRLLSFWTYWRCLTDRELEGMGGWKTRVGLAKLPLREFLKRPEIVCQLDNLAVRTLLWPESGIPGNSGIDPACDRQYLEDAVEKLSTLEFVDVIENPSLQRNLSEWLGQEIVIPRANEFRGAAIDGPIRYSRELDLETVVCLEQHTRLDRELWKIVVRKSMPGVDPERLADQALLSAVARQSESMAGRPTGEQTP